jgi:hypothetical protein
MDISYFNGLDSVGVCWIGQSEFPTTLSLKSPLTLLMMAEYCTLAKVKLAFQGRDWLLI